MKAFKDLGLVEEHHKGSHRTFKAHTYRARKVFGPTGFTAAWVSVRLRMKHTQTDKYIKHDETLDQKQRRQ